MGVPIPPGWARGKLKGRRATRGVRSSSANRGAAWLASVPPRDGFTLDVETAERRSVGVLGVTVVRKLVVYDSHATAPVAPTINVLIANAYAWSAAGTGS